MRLSITIILIVIGLFCSAESLFTEIVKTTKGPVKGEILTTVIKKKQYSSFKGIPYAEPPLHSKRFKPPIEKKLWSNVLLTTQEGSNCVQKDFVYHNYTGSEDCLYLNVYTPKIDFTNENDLKSVMVWIYGGTFKSGYGNSSLYGPDFIIERDVVLVTFNYRLGPLGFLSLNHKDATGNAGLKDQNLVLKWIKDNIASFGGNPDNVTIFGQSAGGVAVDLHVLSEMSKGLFHAAISMSASPLCPWAFSTSKHSEKQAFALGEKLGISTENKDKLLEKLYEISAVTLMEKTEELGSSNPPFAPTIEKSDVAKNQEKFLTDCPYKKYKSGNFTHVPYLTGFTKDETLLFAGSAETFTNYLKSGTDYFDSLTNSGSFGSFIYRPIASIISSFNSVTTSTLMTVVDESSSILFIAGIDSKRKYLKKHSKKPVYFYRFSYETNECLHKLMYNISYDGVAHGDDLGYPFHMTVVDLPLDSKDLTFITRKRMVKMWTNFAKYGNPTPKPSKLLQGLQWKETGSNAFYLDFNKDLSMKEGTITKTSLVYQSLDKFILPSLTGC